MTEVFISMNSRCSDHVINEKTEVKMSGMTALSPFSIKAGSKVSTWGQWPTIQTLIQDTTSVISRQPVLEWHNRKADSVGRRWLEGACGPNSTAERMDRALRTACLVKTWSRLANWIPGGSDFQ